MTLFVIIALLMAVLALALLTRTLWWRASSAANAATPQALQQQLAQVESLRTSGALNDEQAAQARLALEQRIAGAASTPPSAAAPTAPARLLLPTLTLFVLMTAVGGYAWLGAPQALDPTVRAAGSGGGDQAITLEQIEGMAEKLAARLKEQPNDALGWAMLGRSYAVLGRHAQSLPAFKQAMTLQPDDAALMADYADALAVSNGRNLEGEPLQWIDRALARDPNNLKALSLAGTAAFFRKDYAVALRHWEKLAQVQPNSEFVRQIQGGIDEARRLAAGGAAAPSPQATADPHAPADPARSSVSGTVTLAAALAGKASPDDTVFVFARAADGPRIPLAILRKQVKDLPLTFALDDSMAMTPTSRLSSADKVVIGARISKRGEATSRPGDLQGQSAPVTPGARNVSIEIGQVVGN